MTNEIQAMKDLCKEVFENSMIQPYAGANFECMFCGAMKSRVGFTKHSKNCPCLRWYKIKKENNND